MTEPGIITVAITGAVPRKKGTPAVPVTGTEQVESTHEAYEAGASLFHVHVRDENENPSSDPDRFGAFMECVRNHCPDMIVQFSTGGSGRGAGHPGSMLQLQPDNASLAPGSLTFPCTIYTKPTQVTLNLPPPT